MHNCGKTRELFSAWYDGDAPVTLENCAQCEQAYADFTALMDEVRALPAPAVPLDFHARVMKAVRAEAQANAKQLPRRRRAAAPWAGLAAACFAMVAVLLSGVWGATEYPEFVPIEPVGFMGAIEVEPFARPAPPDVDEPAEPFAPLFAVELMDDLFWDVDFYAYIYEEARAWRLAATGLLLFGGLGATVIAIKKWK